MSLPSGRPEQIESKELLARFFNNHKVSKNKIGYNENDGYFVKAALFIPDSHPDTSVSRISGLDEDQIKSIGDEVEKKKEISRASSAGIEVNMTRGVARGAAIVTREVIVSNGQYVEADELPLHHALILGWAGCNGREKLPTYKSQKSARKMQAQEIVNTAEIVFLREESDPVFIAHTL